MPESDLGLAGAEEVHRFIGERARAPADLTASMRELIGLCRGLQPHTGWVALERIDYSAGSAELTKWLKGTLAQRPLSSEIRGLWFGLFNPLYGESGDLIRDGSADVYMGGSKAYVEGDPEHEWACELDYLPDEGYARSTVLANIYELAYRESDGLGNAAEFPLCLGFAAFWMREVLAVSDLRALVAGPIGRGVAVGFDSGDAIDFGVVPP